LSFQTARVEEALNSGPTVSVSCISLGRATMGKKPTGGGDGGKPVGKAAGKAAAKAGKKAKAMEKVERKLKKAGKGKAHSKGADDDDLEAILDEVSFALQEAIFN
jgi:hypothetical protein